MSILEQINKARAEYDLPPIKGALKRINIFAKLPNGGELYLDTTRWARNPREARILLVATRPDYGYAASDLTARYA